MTEARQSAAPSEATLGARDIVREALARLREAGAHSADASLIEGDSCEARVRGEEIDFVKQARERTLGLRAFIHRRGGLSSAVISSSDLSPASLERLAADTVGLARATAPDPHAGLPEDGFAGDLPELALLDPADRPSGVPERIAQARAAERAAWAVDPRISRSEGSEAGSSFHTLAYASTAGFEGAYEAASHFLVSAPIAAENGAMQRDSWLSVARSLAALEAPESVGRRAAERALGQLGARRVRTAEVPVIFDAVSARSVLANLVACLSGYAIYRGSSFLAGRLGQCIASGNVMVIDDGRLRGGLGSRPFDAEGQPTRRNVVIEGGRLASWLLDVYSARKLGMVSTGNASRSPGSGPGAGPTNFWLEPGAASLEEIVAATPRGLLVTGLFGHGFNPVTGDFSRGARGFWIEGGALAHPVEEITVAGQLGAMLEAVDAVGRELLWLGSVAAPPLRVARMTVAGD
jgi:PmbA protein